MTGLEEKGSMYMLIEMVQMIIVDYTLTECEIMQILTFRLLVTPREAPHFGLPLMRANYPLEHFFSPSAWGSKKTFLLRFVYSQMQHLVLFPKSTS